MGCCVLNYSNGQMTQENFEVIVPNDIINRINISKSDKNTSYLDITNKEETHNSTIFPSSLIKSKDNPKGIVVIKMKN